VSSEKLIQKPILRATPLLPLDLLSPSSNISNGVFVSLRVVELWNLLPFPAKFIFFLKTKQQYKPKNRVQKRKAVKETEATEGKHGHHGLGCHYGLAVVGFGRVGLPLPECCVFWCRFAS